MVGGLVKPTDMYKWSFGFLQVRTQFASSSSGVFAGIMMIAIPVSRSCR